MNKLLKIATLVSYLVVSMYISSSFIFMTTFNRLSNYIKQPNIRLKKFKFLILPLQKF